MSALASSLLGIMDCLPFLEDCMTVCIIPLPGMLCHGRPASPRARMQIYLTRMRDRVCIRCSDEAKILATIGH